MDNNNLFNENELNQTFRIDDYFKNNDNNSLFPNEDTSAKENGDSLKAESKEENQLNARFETVSDVYELNLPSYRFDMAISEDGKERYNSEIMFRDALSKPENVGKKYFVFDNEGNHPQCVEVLKNGRFAIASGISSHQQVGKATFEPKKSLKLGDVGEIDSYESKVELEKKLKEAENIKKHPGDYLKKFRLEFSAFKAKENEFRMRIADELASEAGVSYEDYIRKPKAPVNKAPQLTTGNKISRFLYKIITLGFGETNAYLRHKEALRRYQEENKPYFDALKVYKEHKKKFDERFKKEYQDELEKRSEKFHEASERLDFIDTEIQEIKDSMGLSAMEVATKIDEVNAYHGKTEVIMEGIADLKKEGLVTQDNIFANTWMHKTALEGKNPAQYNADDVDHLAQYVVSEIAERKLTENYLNNPKYAEGQQNRTILAGINNGSAVESMKKDTVFKGLLDQAKAANKPMNLKSFSMAVEKGMKMEIAKATNPLNKVKEAQKSLVQSFGQKPLSENSLLDVAKYKYLSNKIKELENNYKENKKWTSADVDSAKNALTYTLGKGRINVGINNYLGAEDKSALKRLCSNPKINAAGKTYSLDKLSEMVTKEKTNPSKAPKVNNPVIK